MRLPTCAWVIDVGAFVGNAYGYSLANRRLYTSSVDCGLIDPNSNIVVWFCHPDLFEPVEGKVNVLFTMYENRPLGESFVKMMNRADALIVPSQWCADLFREHSTLPIYVVP